MLETFHFLHVVAGVVFGGGVVAYSWVIAPALYKMHPDARAEHYKVLEKYAGTLIGLSAVVVILAGIGRLWASGYITSLGDLFSGYGLLATLAVAVIVVWQVIDVPARKRQTEAIAAGDTEAFGRLYRRGRIIDSAALLILLGLMVAMRMGLY